MSIVQPTMIDLYCCQGAASKGYEDAGFRVLSGHDIVRQSRYPYAFEQGDALEVIAEIIGGKRARPSLLHAAPPCQGRTNAQKIQDNEHPMLIGPTRKLLIELGLPYVIENVPLMAGAEDLDPMIDPIMLCGTMFPGLNTRRHRLFESNLPLVAPAHPGHVHSQVKMGRPVREGEWYQAVGNFSNVPYIRENMGVPWMSRDGIRECTPPVYTELLGKQIITYL
jgi:DNA (cytosine-5)-methyltransferase 1